MKKTILLSLAAAFLFYGCGKETPVEQIPADSPEEPSVVDPVLKPIVFTSKASDDDVKVTLDGFNLKFTEGDKIAVASYNFASETSPIHSNYATYDGTETSASGTFTPASGSEYGATWAGSASAVSFYSYYPTTAAPSISGTTATVTNIAATQDGTVSNILCWAKGSQVATAAEVTDGNAPSFNYSPVCALVKLTIKNVDTINAASLNVSWTATSNSFIAGSASLNLLTGVLSGGDAKTVSYSSGASPIVLEKAGDDDEVDIYLSFIPAEITSWDLSITDSRENFVLSTSLDRDWPTMLLPGRMYARTLSVSHVTGVTGSLGTYAGVPFVRGFLKRTGSDNTAVADMSISDATADPLEILNYTNKASSEDSYNMYFSWNELNTIFGGTASNSFETNTIKLGEANYKVPSQTNLETLTSTTRSNAPSINGTAKAWSCVKVTLTDSFSAFGTDYSNKGFESNNTSSDYIKGILFFPDSSTITCSDIDASKSDVFSSDIYQSPNEITSSQLMALVKGGCLFLPFVGGHTTAPAWNSRGSNGYIWSSSYTAGRVLLVFESGSGNISTSTYNGTRHFPVMLIDAD